MRRDEPTRRRRTVVRTLGASLLGVGLAGCSIPGGGEGDGGNGGEDEEDD